MDKAEQTTDTRTNAQSAKLDLGTPGISPTTELDFYGRPVTPKIHQTTSRHVAKQLLAVATTPEQKAIALYWTGCTMDLLKEHGLTLEEYFRFNDGNIRTGGAI